MDQLKSLPWYGQFAIFLGIGLVLGGLFYFLYYSDKQDTIETLVNENADLGMNVNRLQQKEKELAQINATIEATQRELEILKGSLPDRVEIAAILKKIQGLASNARMRILRFTPGTDVDKPMVSELPIPISIEGSYHNLAIFFDQISRMKKIFNITNLAIRTNSSATNSENTITADFTATTYFYKEIQPQVAAAPAPRPQRARGESKGGEDEMGGGA